MVRPFELPLGKSQRGVVLCLAFALGACGRVSLGSMADLDGDPAGASGSTGDDPSRAGAGGAASAGGSTGGGAASGTGGLGGSVADAGTAGSDTGADAGPSGPLPPSCADADLQCGDASSRASCCESPLVSGGSFALQADFATPEGVPVTLSSFRLDRFEVNVGRMRAFVSHYEEWRALGQPEQDLGAHPSIPDSGWQVPRFSDQLPASAAELEARLRDCSTGPPSTYAEGLSDEVPLNCVSWFEAAAFCAWDGGRLPTLRELSYAAAGGSLQRVYPWGDEPVPRRELALFGCIIDTSSPVCTVADITPVGAHPLGAGLFGQEDLAGSMSEWVLDVDAPLDACTDCAAIGPEEAIRRWRASSWVDPTELVSNALFFGLPPEVRSNFLGLRCARAESMAP